MFQELHSASKILQSALDRYLAVCTGILSNPGSLYAVNNPQDISGGIINELDSVITYEKKISQARVAISRIQNSALSIAPINLLPDEVILRIFHFALGIENAAFESHVDIGALPGHSLAIYQVCSRWRHISLGSQHLWSDIYLSAYTPVAVRLVARGEIFASRAGDMPLDLHLVEQLPIDKMDVYRAYFYPFILAIGPRVKSWEIRFARYWDIYLFDILNRCLTHSTPGKLTSLTLKFRINSELWPDDYDFPRDSFLSSYERQGDGDYVVDITNSQLDDLLLPVTILKLDGVFPYWTSKAYHGLVELRLVSWKRAKDSIRIPEKLLVDILHSSPELKILVFGLEIISTKVPHPPAMLRELEELHLQADSSQSQRTLLRLLEPGSKPMQTFISYEYPNADSKFPSSTGDELQEFLRRSNVTLLYLDSHRLHLCIPEFLQLLPNLETLILRHLTLDAVDPSPVLSSRGNSNNPKLHTVHFLFGAIHLDGFRWMCNTDNLQLQRVTTCLSVIEVGQEPQPYPPRHAHLLQDIFPTLEILGNYENAYRVKGWDDLTSVRYRA